MDYIPFSYMSLGYLLEIGLFKQMDFVQMA